MKIRDIYETGKNILNGIESASYDALCLLEHYCGAGRTDLLLNPDKETESNRFIDACKKRAEGIPLQYIIGEWEFMGLPFYVCPDVLIPRADTETVVEYVIKNYEGNLRILDMCTGSGCIGLSVKHFMPESKVTLCDISEPALAVARKNADRLGLDVLIKQTDLLRGGGFYFPDGAFDLILSNPPYIKRCDMGALQKEVTFEPYIALDGGEDGTDFYRALINDWDTVLSDGGRMVLEVGYDTADAVSALFCECGYTDITCLRDINGVVRVITAKKGTGKI